MKMKHSTFALIFAGIVVVVVIVIITAIFSVENKISKNEQAVQQSNISAKKLLPPLPRRSDVNAPPDPKNYFWFDPSYQFINIKGVNGKYLSDPGNGGTLAFSADTPGASELFVARSAGGGAFSLWSQSSGKQCIADNNGVFCVNNIPGDSNQSASWGVFTAEQQPDGTTALKNNFMGKYCSDRTDANNIMVCTYDLGDWEKLVIETVHVPVQASPSPPVLIV
jgi:hypothetical protein